MAYSTPAMVRKALVPKSDGAVPSPVSRTAADLTDAELADFISEADALIDTAVGGRYVVPIQPQNGSIPHPVDYWSRNIAMYLATLSYRGSQDFTDDDPVARRYNATMIALGSVTSGQAALPVPSNTTPSAVAGVGTAINPYVGDLFGPRDFDLVPWGEGRQLNGHW